MPMLLEFLERHRARHFFRLSHLNYNYKGRPLEKPISASLFDLSSISLIMIIYQIYIQIEMGNKQIKLDDISFLKT